ncbi:MAG: NAD(P)H-dependent oxidoreductase [Sphingomonas sp.]|uniref:NAD(P)H-dependent oxidoreductase n=1 Tax=Sphingomonas sp. TaxID=28214 RepID=UPI001B2042AF|nr:NAD(P)H-dependent oxidoreductase [Sphingomonas sp.]MBO9624556.1 NAD(P)H-dependent oxidoreductase [Sphingomonas sp.]
MGDAHSEPIRHLVVLGHPVRPSFVHSVAEAYRDEVAACGQEAVVRDLYALGFDPVLKAEELPGASGNVPSADLRAELDLLRGATIVTFVYPVWFGLPPAIIKGYVERVLGAGFDPSGIGQGAAQPALQGKRLMQFSSSATTLPWLEEQGQWVSLYQGFGRYLSMIFGMTPAEHVHFDAVVEEERERVLEERLSNVRERTRAVCAAMLSERHAARHQMGQG